MLKLRYSIPGASTLKHLAERQLIIDGLAREEKVLRAQTLWDSKNSSKIGKAAFLEISSLLIDLCVSTKICNYCEQNEATDIEHIYPKSFFPEKTFVWFNYLLACSTCNTHYKLDKFAVFDPAMSSFAVLLQRRQLYSSTDAAFIDPRAEDPLNYLFLDIIGRTFYLIPHPNLTDPRSVAKAERTLDVLQIGKRAALVAARERAFRFYQSQLEQYRDVRDATSWERLESLAQDPHLVDKTHSFQIEKKVMLSGIMENITGHSHPTVWREMQRQHHSLVKTKKLFEEVPEALLWV